MTNTKYTIYWTYNVQPHSMSTNNLIDALKHVETLRKNAKEVGNSAITMVGESSDRVGNNGVDSVQDGKLPDGNDYSWNMSARIGATKK